MRGLIGLFGGADNLVRAVDAMFAARDTRAEGEYNKSADISGLIGQYVHGNEPSHHIPYLYALAGRPDKTAETVRKICSELYGASPDGLCGNDDCGQMSAWYLFSAMGFYPVNPNGLEYVVGAPQIGRAEISLPGGKKFTVVAHGLSEENKYVSAVSLNGKPLKGGVISHADILAGGKLEFFMAPK